MLRRQAVEANPQTGSDSRRVRLDAVGVDYLEDRPARRAGHGIAAEGVEVDSLGEGPGDLGRCHDRAHRSPVADPLGHRDDVGHNALRLEAPPVAARPCESSLHLVGDAQAAGRPGVLVGGLQVAVGKHDCAPHALDALGDVGGDAARRAEADQIRDVGCILLARPLVVVSPGTAVAIRTNRVMNAAPLRHVELPGVVAGEPHREHAAAVVAVSQGDHVVVAGENPGHEDRQVVGL